MIDHAYEELPAEFKSELGAIALSTSFIKLIERADEKIGLAMQELDYEDPLRLRAEYTRLQLQRELLHDFYRIISKAQPK